LASPSVTSELSSAVTRSAPGPAFPGPFFTSRAWHRRSIWRLTCRETSPLRSTITVPECSPVVHRLRLAASAKARLTRRGLTFRRNPEVFGACGSHACLATHAGILTCLTSTHGSPWASPLRQRSPTAKQSRRIVLPAASVAGLSPVTLSAPPRLTSELLRTL
jgi:hypothetical protein